MPFEIKDIESAIDVVTVLNGHQVKGNRLNLNICQDPIEQPAKTILIKKVLYKQDSTKSLLTGTMEKAKRPRRTL